MLDLRNPGQKRRNGISHLVAATVVDGKLVAQAVRDRVRGEVEAFKKEFGSSPQSATVLVGQDPASQVYVRNKKAACAEVGIESLGHELPATVSQRELDALVQKLNGDPAVSGILVQLPLPDGLDAERVIELIDPDKDVDGLTTISAGRLTQGLDCLVPCTSAGVIELADSTGIELEGAEAVVLGRSKLVGRPLVSLLLARNATVTVCHSKTDDLAAVCSRADLLVAAVGRPKLVGADMVKPGAVVIDVGINRTDSGLVGDVDFDAISTVASAITPVPGGVGPMTIAMLLQNTVRAARFQAERAS